MRLLAALLVSCAPSAKPPTVVAPLPPTAPVVVEVTCAQASSIMAANLNVDEVAALCATDHWTVEIRTCLAKAADIYRGYDCLAELTDAQKVGFAELAANGVAGDLHDDDVHEPSIACEDAIHETNMWDPAPAHGEEKNVEQLAAMRKRVLVEACNRDEWDVEERSCFAKASDRATTNGCAAKLPPDKLQRAASQIERVDELLEKMIKGEKSPPSCAAVSAKHYGDAAWKGKLGELNAAERKRLIAHSREMLLDACKAWDGQTKVCMFLGGGADCFGEIYEWTYPTAGLAPSKTGIAACDAYLHDMALIEKCTAIPRATRDQLRDSFAPMQEMFSNLGGMNADQRKAMAESCGYGADALQELLHQQGC